MLTFILLCFKVWEHPGLYPSEPVFVPLPGTTEEDEGVIMSVVITPNKVSSPLNTYAHLLTIVALLTPNVSLRM